MTQAKGDDPAAQAEVRHKVANIFQLLSTLTRLRMQRPSAADGRRDLAWLLEMTAALAATQQRLLTPGGDFSGCLEDLAERWRRARGDRPIAIEVTSAPLSVQESHASALALIASELVLNALTHGFPEGRSGAINVTLETAGDRAVLTVVDEGIGYDPAAVDDARLGLWLIRGLAVQVRGELVTTTDGGVRARLAFPMQEP